MTTSPTPTASSPKKLYNKLRSHPTLKPCEEGLPNHLHSICFHHPGYLEDDDELLRLYAFDQTSGGLHYGTAFLACAIIAVNSFDGYLSETRDGPRLNLESDEVLDKNDYYFHFSSTQDGDDPYPVFMNFDHWIFHPGTKLKHWPESSLLLDPNVLGRDYQCLITASTDYLEAAHILPLSEEKWFKRNRMSKYTIKTDLGNYPLEDVSNTITLRPDLHIAFDRRSFLIARKNNEWVLHFLQVTSALGALYHNTTITLSNDISESFLFARFAWAIFPSLQTFLQTGSSRRVCVRVGDQYSNLTEIKSANYRELQGVLNPSKSRNTSENKRQRGSTTGSADSGEYVMHYALSNYPDDTRGRKRYRSSSRE